MGKINKITSEKLIRKNVPITRKEKLWIDEMLHKLEITNDHKLIINQIYQMAKTYSNSEFTLEDLFKKSLDVFIIHAPTKGTFKNPVKCNKQVLLRVRMKILEAIGADEKPETRD